MRRIFWDTMIFAYLIEDHPVFGEKVATIYEGMERRGDRLCASLVVLGELLVGPARLNDLAAAAEIERFLRSRAVTLLPFEGQAPAIFARLRADLRLKSIDALHLATAAAVGVDVFLTNDRRLHAVNGSLAGLPFVMPVDSDYL